MPVLRYFAYVGCLLVALLFAADWYWPGESKLSAQQASAESPVEQTIRIQSERRWPDKIEFDTTQPTIIPSPTPVIISSPAPAAAPVVAANSPLDARAEVKPAARPAPPKRQAKVRHRTPRQDYYYERRPAYASASPTSPFWSFGSW